MRSVLYLVRKPPGGLANEMIDMMLVSGVFEQPARVLFLDDGVRQLASGQDATLVDRKDTAKALGALPAYDVDELFAHAGSLAACGIGPDDMAVDARVVDDREVAKTAARRRCGGDGLTCLWFTWSVGQARWIPACATSARRMKCCCSPTASMPRRTRGGRKAVVCAIEDDAAARGVSLDAPVRAIGYEGFVERRGRARCERHMDVTGVALDRDGYLKDLSQWSEDLARDLADGMNLTLTPEPLARDRHGARIPCRDRRGPGHASTSETCASAARRGVRLEHRALMRLFPGNPAKLIAKIGGLPRPTNCDV